MESATRCRSMRWFGALLRVEVAQDIVSDVAENERTARDLAHAAEVHAIEARKAIESAQAPDSEGGEMITTAEAKRVASLLRSSAEHAHEATEVLAYV